MTSQFEQKCQEVFARGQKSNWGYEWFRAFKPIFEGFISDLHHDSKRNDPKVGKSIKLSATFILQGASKIVPYMPKFDKYVDSFHLLSKLNDLAWWHDELAEMERIVRGEEAAGAVEPVTQKKEAITRSAKSTAKPGATNTRKRPADDDDPLEESPTKKVARPSGHSQTGDVASLAHANHASTSSSRRPQVDEPKKTCAPGTSLASEHADNSVFEAFEDIRGLFAEGIKRLNKLETKILQS